MHVERVIAAADLMCTLGCASEMSLLSVVTCETSCCMLVSQSFQEVFNVAWKLENTVLPVIMLSFTHLPRRTSTTWLCGKVQFWINRVASKIGFHPLDPDTGAPLHEERVIAVRQESNVHFVFNL